MELTEPFEAKEFDLFSREWYLDSRITSSWSDVYQDFTDGALIISVCIKLDDASGNLVGVAAADILLSSLERSFQAALRDANESRLFVFESGASIEDRLVASNIPGVSIDASGLQVACALAKE